MYATAFGAAGAVPEFEERWVDLALEEERALVESLGGYTLEVAGARLVTHERIPVPRFNFVQEVRVSGHRQAAFFERALDHYFQRALRPSVRLGEPAPPHLDRSLRALGFKPRSEPHFLLLALAPGRAAPPDPVRTRVAREPEVDQVVAFWAAEKEREELRRSVEVASRYPNPDEQLIPLLAERGGRPTAAALLHAHRGVWAVHAVATRPDARGQGVATAMVADALTQVIPAGTTVAMHAESTRLAGHLAQLGFREVRRSNVYDLPPEAELSLPPVPATGGPRWRPPRSARPA